MILEDRKIRYRLPTKIVSFGGEIENVDTLLKEKDDQIYLDEVDSDLVKIKGPGYIILDFGEEIAGGVRLLVHYGGKESHKMRCRFRFGESLGEVSSEIGEKNATNHHALRDFENDVTYLSDQSYGDTGYRFLRIDILESEIYHPIKSIYAKEWYRDLPRINNFESEDKLSKQIFETCVHTLDLCMQGRVWDGIKRDRLVWIGDMEPEIHALLHVYGNIPLVEKTLETAVRSNPMPKWINNMPSYSAWFLLIIYDVFKIGKNKEIVKKYETYLKEIIHLGLNRKTNVLLWKQKVKANAKKKLLASWNGFTQVQKDVRQNIKNTSHAITNLWHRNLKNNLKIHKFLFLQDHALEIK
jgi:hypothetical protein